MIRGENLGFEHSGHEDRGLFLKTAVCLLIGLEMRSRPRSVSRSLRILGTRPRSGICCRPRSAGRIGNGSVFYANF